MISSKIEKIDTLVIGAGQAGIAMSEHLGRSGVPHLVLERERIAERWRTGRWDSLVANGPAWHDRFPGMEFPGIPADGFPDKEQVTDYFVAYAKQINAPIRCGVEVTEVKKQIGQSGFVVSTSQGLIEADSVIVATGPFQIPLIPPVIPHETPVKQMHSHDYRNPDQLEAGAVLVVGAGSSGSQIAEELVRAGRRVYLSVGPHDRPPRRYRGRDFVWWLGVLGKWDHESMEPGREHVTIAVSGARGGHTVDFRRFAQLGITLTGMSTTCENGVLHFASDLSQNVASGDANYLSLLDEADAYVERNGLDLPEEPEARHRLPDPTCMSEPLAELNLAAAGIKTVIWATGFASDYSWLKMDVLDAAGKPHHRRGVSSEPGLYFLGLPWQSRRGSSFIWGVWHDAQHVAQAIAVQQKYRDYHLDRPHDMNR